MFTSTISTASFEEPEINIIPTIETSSEIVTSSETEISSKAETAASATMDGIPTSDKKEILKKAKQILEQKRECKEPELSSSTLAVTVTLMHAKANNSEEKPYDECRITEEQFHAAMRKVCGKRKDNSTAITKSDPAKEAITELPLIAIDTIKSAFNDANDPKLKEKIIKEFKAIGARKEQKQKLDKQAIRFMKKWTTKKTRKLNQQEINFMKMWASNPAKCKSITATEDQITSDTGRKNKKQKTN